MFIPSLELVSLRGAFLGGELSAAEVLDRALTRLAEWDDPALWIARPTESAVRDRARVVDRAAAADPGFIERTPLFGIPFAVKDNIDVAGMPTTAGCPAFAYTPCETAPVVARLLGAGGILLGKTNLDQFATGLVGTRSPYGVPRNPFDARFIPGGSSSGSAVAVAAGLVSFALGTDTAGSGRVPAAFNNIVGLKPTRGLISTRGVVPACQSLDCVSVFALTVPDAAAVLEVMRGADPEHGDSRPAPPRFACLGTMPARFTFGVPRPGQRQFFGNPDAAPLFEAALARLVQLGGAAAEG